MAVGRLVGRIPSDSTVYVVYCGECELRSPELVLPDLPPPLVSVLESTTALCSVHYASRRDGADEGGG